MKVAETAQGKEIASFTADDRKLCPLCGGWAVVPLTPKQLAAQPDETTHVCHPVFGGCNHGFGPAKRYTTAGK